MPLEATYLNHAIPLLDAHFDAARKAQYEAVSHLYNRWLGPVTLANLLRPEPVDLPLYTSSCRHVSVGDLITDLSLKQAIADAVIIPAGGKGVDSQTAVLGGLGEIAERLLAVLHFCAIEDSLELATYDELIASGRNALSPSQMPLFAREQYAATRFPYQRFDAEAPLRWLPGTDLVSDRAILVPAQLVLLYYKHARGEARIAYPTTGGLAFHADARDALIHAFCEVVERDAINTNWYRRVAPERVSIDLAGVASTHDRGWPRRWSTPHIDRVEVYRHDATVPIPVFTTVAVDASRTSRSFLGGGGSGTTRSGALAQALFELGQSRTSLKFYRSIGFKDIRADSTVSEMTDFFDAAIFYGYAENLPRLDWYRSTSRGVEWDEIVEPPGALDDPILTLQKWSRNAHINPIVFDFSGACWPGVSVTKVLIPELTQASLPSHPYLGHPRFYESTAATGGRRLTFADLNTDPVPFP